MRTKLRKTLLMLFMSVAVLLTLSTTTKAQTTGAKVSLTFDDALSSTYTNVVPILEEYDMQATIFIPTQYVGLTDYMTWSQIKSLQNVYGWEVGSHTVNHSELPLLTTTQIRTQLVRSKNILTNRGLKVTSFASPFGAYDNRVLIETAKLYNVHRGFWDRNDLNVYPYNNSVFTVKSVESATTLQQVETWIDQAKAENKWLVLVFHEVQTDLDPDYEYTTTINDLKYIVEYISNSGINVVNLNHTLQKPGPNLLTNSSFANGISQGWSTDNATQVLLNTGNNGSYPSPVQSIVFKGSTSASHLFSNQVTNSSSQYSLKAFVNANALTIGELGFYIDEYDSNGNWISGQWIGAVYSDGTKVTHFSKVYQPTSDAVSSFSVQTYISSGSQGKVFVDNYELYTY